MKNRFIASVLLVVMIVVVSSCATSRKYGCPTVSVKKEKVNA